MDIYGQDAELELLTRLAGLLTTSTMIDVGAELGSVSAAVLHAGCERVYAFEPNSENVRVLRDRLGVDGRVVVHELALGDHDGSAQLRVSAHPDGSPLSFGHTLLECADTDEIVWSEVLPVQIRSLGSLLADGQIPARAGILKVDAEGSDLAVVRGMGALEADLVMVEHWSDLPRGLGPCPWTVEDLMAELRPRGFQHYAFLVHRGELVSLKWDDATIEPGFMGNLLFVHQSSLDRLLPAILTFACELGERLVRGAERYIAVADERRRVLEETATIADGLKLTAEERLSLVLELEQTADERLRLVYELEQAADERLSLVHELVHEANQRLHALEEATARVTAQDAELAALRADLAH